MDFRKILILFTLFWLLLAKMLEITQTVYSPVEIFFIYSIFYLIVLVTFKIILYHKSSKIHQEFLSITVSTLSLPLFNF